MNAVRKVLRVAKHALASTPGWRAAAPVLRRRGVIVLTYHRILGADRTFEGIPVERFAEQMRWVRANCDPIRPEELVTSAERPTRARPAVLITFDDGYRDYHDLAYPVLRDLKIPALVFVATSFLDGGGLLWTEEVQWAVARGRAERVVLPWGGEPVMLKDAAARAALGVTVRAHVKKVPDAERRKELRALFAALDAPPMNERQMLTWDEVRRTLDFTTYGGHSHTHPILSRLPRAQADEEIKTCRDRILAETGRMPTMFAYPNGRPTDYTPETQELLRTHGFDVAFASTEGLAGPGTDWMAVKRMPSGDYDVPDFVWVAAGFNRG
jgi:peptidoglycan/xylan/chitin deacetylase (PgdA/CDA1 family)